MTSVVMSTAQPDGLQNPVHRLQVTLHWTMLSEITDGPVQHYSLPMAVCSPQAVFVLVMQMYVRHESACPVLCVSILLDKNLCQSAGKAYGEAEKKKLEWAHKEGLLSRLIPVRKNLCRALHSPYSELWIMVNSLARFCSSFLPACAVIKVPLCAGLCDVPDRS